jgi:hypothetical protein
MLSPASAIARARDEHGTTLVEVLVASSTGMLVSLALFAILQVATHQQARLTDVVQANQIGRTAMTKIVDELHSACIAPEFKPIEEGSTGSELRFENAYSSEAIVPVANKERTGAFRHVISWEEKTGKIIDHTYPSTGGSAPSSYTFGSESPVGGTIIATNVSRVESGGKPLPIFRYYSYATESSSGTEAGLNTLSSEPLTIPEKGLSSTTAGTVASVLVTFNTSAANKASGIGSKSELGDTIELSNQVTLAFSAPKSESVTADGPCQ